MALSLNMASKSNINCRIMN